MRRRGMLSLLVTQGPLGGEGLFGVMQTPLHLPKLSCRAELLGFGSGLTVSEPAHPCREVIHLLVLLLMLWLLALRLPRRFARKGLLAFGLLCELASHVVGGYPHVVGEIVHRGRRVRTQKKSKD